MEKTKSKFPLGKPMPSFSEADKEAFWKQVKKPADPNGCWTIGKGSGYQVFLAAGFAICHKCDNKGCIRSDHLFKGTQKDNIDDFISKGLRRKKAPRKQLPIRQTEEEYQFVRLAADRLGISMSAFMRMAALEHARTKHNIVQKLPEVLHVDQ